jgi:MFS transporter, FSR family, fosmidomycin resistance protein
MLLLGWRGALMLVGLLGLPVVLAIFWQSRLLIDQAHGLAIGAASSALTGHMTGMIGGVLAGGWVADRTDRHLPFVVVLTIGAALLLLLTGIVSLAELPTIGVLFVAGVLTWARRTPRDVVVKDAAPPG